MFGWAPGVPIIDEFEVPVAHEQAVNENNYNDIDKEYNNNGNENLMQINGIKD